VCVCVCCVVIVVVVVVIVVIVVVVLVVIVVVVRTCVRVLFRISPAQSPNTSGAYESARAAGDVTAAVGIAPVAFPPTTHPPRRPTPVLHWTRLLVLHSLPFAHDPTTTPVRLQTTHTTLPCCRYYSGYIFSLTHTRSRAGSHRIVFSCFPSPNGTHTVDRFSK